MPDERLFPATLMPDSDWWHALWPNPDAVLRNVGIKPGKRVVDLCCGDGHFTRPMCESSLILRCNQYVLQCSLCLLSIRVPLRSPLIQNI